MKLMSFWSKFFIALAITILATTGAVVGVFAGQKEQIDMGGSIKYTVPYFTVEFLNYDDTVFETQQVAYGHDAVAPANNPTRTGYTFKGWTDYTNITGNRRVASQWDANKYHVTYSPNGGTGNNYVVEVTYEQPFIALDVTDTNLGYTRTGYTFSHWTESSNGGTSWDGYIGKPWTWTYTHDITLYAQWTANKYTVTANANGGTIPTTSGWTVASGGATATKQVTYDSTYGTLPTPTRTGYDFQGWFTAQTDGSKVESSTTVKTASNHTIYAHWKESTYTITFNPNGGSVSPTTKNVTYDSTYGTLPTPTKTGYTFNGWVGKNLFNKEATPYKSNYYLRGADGVEVSYDAYHIYQIVVSPGLTLTIKNSGQSSAPGFAYYTANGTYISGQNYATNSTVTTTVPANACFLRFSVNHGESYRLDLNYFQIELGSSATSYEAYQIVTSSTKVTRTSNHTLLASWTLNESYLRKDWQTALTNNNANFTGANIKTIQFVNTVPSGSGYTQVSVGATTSAGTTAYASGTAGVSDIIAYVKANSSDNTKYDIIFYSPVTIYAPSSSYYLFGSSSSVNQLANLTSISFGNFNTSKVTNMSGMFYHCSSLTSLNLSNFDTSNVTNMSSMFYYCSSLTSLNVSSFNTSNVTDMFGMFWHCKSLTSLNVSSFNTSNVTNMYNMFSGCSSLTSLNVSSFNTSNVTNMRNMFGSCESLTSLNVSNFNTSNVTNMNGMFYHCSSLTSLNVSSFNTSNVTDMGSMFNGCSSLTSLNISNFDTSNVTDMWSMFNSCSSLTSLNLSSFNTSNVTNMRNMFASCSKLTSLNLSNFNTSNVTDMYYMFSGCSSLTSLDVSNFDTSNVTNMYYMFSGCSSLTSLDVSNFDTSNVTNMGYMFYNCSSLTSLNLSSFNTSNVTEMGVMFYKCSKLTSLNLSSFDMSKVTYTSSMLGGCSGLTEIKTPKAIGSTAVDLPKKTKYSWFEQANTNNAYTQITSACLSKTLVLHENYSYLRTDWQTALINNNANFKQENIKTIQFVKSAPSGSGYTTVSVGATTSAGTTAYASGTAGVQNITAWVKANSSDSTKYDVIFYSPVTIYAPVDSTYLFSNSSSSKSLTNLTSISFANFNTSNVTDMKDMFGYCVSLTSLNVSSFDTSKITNMQEMFLSCSSLTSLDLSSFNTSKVTNMSWMFYDCSKLTSLDVSNFNTNNVKYMSSMFYDCSKLTSLNLSNFNTSKVTYMSYMFYNCSKLTSLNVSSFNTSNVTNMSYMFYYCSKLTSLNLSSFDMSRVTETGYMLDNCSSLTEIKTPKAIGSKAISLPSSDWYNKQTGAGPYSSITSSMVSNGSITLKKTVTVTRTVTGTSSSGGGSSSFTAETTYNGVTFKLSFGAAYGYWSGSIHIGTESKNYSGQGTIPTNWGPETFTSTTGYTVKVTKTGTSVTFVITY